MRVLAIDTALGACSACILDTRAGEPVASESILMERGHAEALLPLLDRVVSAVQGGFRSSTGSRSRSDPAAIPACASAISAARGVGARRRDSGGRRRDLSAYLAPLLAARHPRPVAAAIDARTEHVYIQAVAPGGRTVIAPVPVERARGRAGARLRARPARRLRRRAHRRGSRGARRRGSASPTCPRRPTSPGSPASGRVADPAQALPKPLYLRGPDAKPQDGARIARQ